MIDIYRLGFFSELSDEQTPGIFFCERFDKLASILLGYHQPGSLRIDRNTSSIKGRNFASPISLLIVSRRRKNRTRKFEPETGQAYPGSEPKYMFEIHVVRVDPMRCAGLEKVLIFPSE